MGKKTVIIVRSARAIGIAAEINVSQNNQVNELI
jgi:hypothetical protein